MLNKLGKDWTIQLLFVTDPVTGALQPAFLIHGNLYDATPCVNLGAIDQLIQQVQATGTFDPSHTQTTGFPAPHRRRLAGVGAGVAEQAMNPG